MPSEVGPESSWPQRRWRQWWPPGSTPRPFCASCLFAILTQVCAHKHKRAHMCIQAHAQAHAPLTYNSHARAHASMHALRQSPSPIRGGLAAVLDVWPCFAHRMQVVTALAIWGRRRKGLDHLAPALGVWWRAVNTSSHTVNTQLTRSQHASQHRTTFLIVPWGNLFFTAQIVLPMAS